MNRFVPFAGIPAVDNPRLDPDFIDVVLNDLIDHKYQWRKVGEIFTAADLDPAERSWIVRHAVDAGRRVGLAIAGDRERGYRYVGFQRVRYVRPKVDWPPLLEQLALAGARA